MSKVALNGMGLKEVQNANLLMYGVGDFQDQMALVHHIDGLTGRKQKMYQQPQQAYDYGGNNNNNNIGPGAGGGNGEQEGNEGQGQTAGQFQEYIK